LNSAKHERFDVLSYDLSKSCSGVVLIGDYTSLRSLHTVLHDINERSPLIDDKEGLFLGLAYDVRKAFERQRETIEPPAHFEEIGVRYGVNILWPVLLVQQRIMRASLAYIDSSALDQAMTYALESVIEVAIKADFPASSADIIELWKQLPTDLRGVAKLHSRGGLFCSWSKIERARKFKNLLASFSSAYEFSYAERARNEERDLVDPHEFLQWDGSEWPDPNW